MMKLHRMKSIAAAVSLCLGALLALHAAQAVAMHQVAYDSFSGSVVTFENLVLSGADYSLLEGLQTSGGVQFGERFAGQELSVTKAPRPDDDTAQNWYDDLSYGTPTSGLALLAGDTGQNLGASDYLDADGKALAGVGSKPGDSDANWGYGAISARFASGQSALGFQLRDAFGGDGFLSLYRADGSLIETVHIASVQNSFYAYARDDGVADIAGFSLYHRAAWYGIAIDNLKFSDGVSAVPESSQTLLLAAGLLAVGFAARRRIFSDSNGDKQ
jgi:hypothetical protein